MTNFFEDKRTHWALNAAVLLAIFYAFYGGFQAPGWTTTLYVTSYFDGVYRRSLIGTLLYFIGDERTNYHFIALIQILTSLFFFWLLICRVYRSSYQVKIICFLFFISQGGILLVSLAGHPDYLLYTILLICSVYPMKENKKILFVSLSPLIHELAAFTIIPHYFSQMILRKTSYHELNLFAAFSFIAFFFAISNPVDVNSDRMITLKEQIKEGGSSAKLVDDYFDHVFRRDIPPFKNYYEIRQRFAIFILLLLAFFVSIHRGLEESSKRQMVLAGSVVFMACISPLLAGFFAWDKDRWVALGLLSTFLHILLSKRTGNRFWFVLIVILFALFASQVELIRSGGLPRPFQWNAFIQFFSHELWEIIHRILGR